MTPLDTDELLAAVDLVGRAGASQFEIGWLNDEDDPAYAERGAEWWAKATYQGTRLIVEGFAGLPPHQIEVQPPVQAMNGGVCDVG